MNILFGLIPYAMGVVVLFTYYTIFLIGVVSLKNTIKVAVLIMLFGLLASFQTYGPRVESSAYIPEYTPESAPKENISVDEEFVESTERVGQFDSRIQKEKREE